ncbi:hypothetical protein [Adhaeribacter pallidiroseus]|uniref:hypothetical protein n=1 Tax=Adhaeribacter pallidiroseus TaxID=2072847 RepID=UPI000E1B7714|nr:hypothetical protein [Adhaeribacter pallidiroseus]
MERLPDPKSQEGFHFWGNNIEVKNLEVYSADSIWKKARPFPGVIFFRFTGKTPAHEAGRKFFKFLVNYLSKSTFNSSAHLFSGTIAGTYRGEEMCYPRIFGELIC